MEGEVRLFSPVTPPSLNQVGARGAPRAFHRVKREWQETLSFLLMAAPTMPRRVSFVEASARLHFQEHRRRDEGNYRALIEKALGDALTGDLRAWPEGRWLADDTPDRYRFTTVEFAIGREVAGTVLALAWRL